MWQDRVRDDIKEKGEEVYDRAHGGVCHRTSTPHKSGNKMKEKNKKNEEYLTDMFM